EGVRASWCNGRIAADPQGCEPADDDPRTFGKTRIRERIEERPMASDRAIETLFDERRTFPPTQEFAAKANANDQAIYESAVRDFEGFWAEQAGLLDWMTPWHTVLEWDLPFAKWFVGGTLNVSVNCLDRHVRS